ncbi:MAG: hypothetical protein ABL999_12620 [Pyrinomonadaceae bacterium]
MLKNILLETFIVIAFAAITSGYYAQPTWMSDNARILGAKRLNEIAIPGAHDAGTFAIVPAKRTDILFGKGDGLTSPDNKRNKQLLSVSGLFSRWAKTQERTTAEMLDDGIRYLDIRVCVNEKGILMTCHGVYGAPLESILDDVKVFTDKNPRELIILGFNHFWDRKYQVEQNKDQGEIEGLTNEKWTELVRLLKEKLQSKLVSSRKFNPSSKLSDVWQATGGSHVIALFDSAAVPDDDLIWKQQEENTWVGGWEMNSFKLGTQNTLKKAKEKAFADKFFAIRSSVTPDDTGNLIGFGLVSKDYPSSATELAEATNPVVFGWIKNEWAGKYPINLIWADYYNRHGLVELTHHLNGIPVKFNKLKTTPDTKWKRWKKPGTNLSF